MAIMDIEFFDGEIFVAGVSNEEFASTLRRIPFPFDGDYGATKVEIFHVAHDQYETRAPIRSMVAKTLDGIDYVIATYTCSPVVMIPISDLGDGAKISGRTIADMGNGQPVDMVSFKNPRAGGADFLYVTNNSRAPRLLPIAGMDTASALEMEDFPRGMKFDGFGLPVGPVGEP